MDVLQSGVSFLGGKPIKEKKFPSKVFSHSKTFSTSIEIRYLFVYFFFSFKEIIRFRKLKIEKETIKKTRKKKVNFLYELLKKNYVVMGFFEARGVKKTRLKHYLMLKDSHFKNFLAQSKRYPLLIKNFLSGLQLRYDA